MICCFCTLLAPAELVRKNDIKVVLTGEGADEMPEVAIF